MHFARSDGSRHKKHSLAALAWGLALACALLCLNGVLFLLSPYKYKIAPKLGSTLAIDSVLLFQPCFRASL